MTKKSPTKSKSIKQESVNEDKMSGSGESPEFTATPFDQSSDELNLGVDDDMFTSGYDYVAGFET